MMIIKNRLKIFFSLALAGFFLFIVRNGFCLEELPNGWQANDISVIGDNLYKRNGGDPYFIFPEFSEPVCSVSGVRLILKFFPNLSKPFLAEIFWKPENGGFNEADKVFFILHPAKNSTLDIVVPIRRDVGYNQIRFDLPRDLNSAFSIEDFEVVDIKSYDDSSKLIESFSILSSEEAEEPDILFPYILHTLKHGATRLSQDALFCFIWLGAILLTLLGIRKTAKLVARDKVE